MNKNRLFIGLFFLIALAGFSFDGGGLIKTGIGFNFNKPQEKDLAIAMNHFDGISLWAEQNLDKEGLYNLSIQGSYLFRLSKVLKPVAQKSVLTHILDLDMFKFSALFPVEQTSMLLEIGRYGLADSTGFIFNQNIDGVFFSYKIPKFSTHFNLGYTGLLNYHTAKINALPDADKKVTKIYSLAPSFLAITGFFHIPVGIYKHNIDIELNSFVQPKKDPISKSYASLSASGPIVSQLFFIVSGISELRTIGKKVEFGFATNADLGYYFSKYSAKLGFKTQWFSGGKNSFDSFTQINAAKSCFIETKNLWKNNLYVSIKPVPELSLAADFNVFLLGKYVKDDSFYKGFECAFSTNYIILQDIFLGLNTGVFIDSKNDIKTILGLKGVLSF